MTNDITFDENKYQIKSRTILGQAEVPGMTRFLLRKGIVKNEKAAQMTLLWSAIIFLGVSLIIFSVFIFDIRFTQGKPEDPEAVMRRQAVKEKVLEMRNGKINNTSGLTQ